MITKAAVQFKDLRQNKMITIPCHRHCDAFFVMKEMGYRRFEDYEEVAQGFLDEMGHFLTRHEAFKEAMVCGQLLPNADPDDIFCEVLYSEDLW